MAEQSSEDQTQTDTSASELNQAEKLLLNLLMACHTTARIGVDVLDPVDDMKGFKVNYFNDAAFIKALRDACDGKLKGNHAYLFIPVESVHIFYIHTKQVIDLNKVNLAAGDRFFIRRPYA